MQWENRNYSLAGSFKNLQAYERIRDSIGHYVHTLAALISDNYTQRGRVNQLQSKLSALVKLSDHAVGARKQKGFNEVSFRRIVGDQIRFYNEIDKVLNDIRKEENRLLIARETADRKNLAYANYTFLGIAFLLGLMLAGTGAGIILFLNRNNRREREVAQSEARFRLLVDSLKDVGIYTINERGYIANWYEGAHHVKGYTPEEVVGRHFSMFFTDEDVNAGEPQKMIDMALRFGSYGVEGWRLKNGGARFWADVLVNAVYADDGKLSYLTIVTRDFSDRKKIEEERVLALNREKELSQMKSNFVSLASHEFRTPLSTILSSVSLLEQYRSTETQDKRDRHIQRIKTSISDMVNTLDEFLSLEKIEAGKASPVNTLFNMKMLVSRLCENAGSGPKPTHVEYRHSGAENVMLDSTFLGHIVTNLLSNAIKYSPDNTDVVVSSEIISSRVILKVKDEGIGISDDDQQRLFQRFFRASNTGKIKGTGLGLHITKRYVELMGGRIDVKSKLDHGTEFTITLPLAAQK